MCLITVRLVFLSQQGATYATTTQGGQHRADISHLPGGAGVPGGKSSNAIQTYGSGSTVPQDSAEKGISEGRFS